MTKALLGAISLLFSIGAVGSVQAFTSSIAESRIKTLAYSAPSVMPPYGAFLHGEILTEIQRTALPFRLNAPARVVVIFVVNRQGELVHVSMPQKSRAKIIDDYVQAMVRAASRRFPAPTDATPGEVLAFKLPITLAKSRPDGR